MRTPSPGKRAGPRVSKPRNDLQRRAIDAVRRNLDELAKAAGVTRWALSSYRAGRREMPPRVRRRLAAYLEKQAVRLRQIAAELRR